MIEHLAAWGGLGAAILIALSYIFRQVKQSGVDAQKVKEAAAREKELDRLQRASSAKPTGGVLTDPNNRDNRKT